MIIAIRNRIKVIAGNQPDSALFYSNKLLPFAKQCGNEKIYASLLNRKGDILNSLGKPNEAIAVLKEAERIFRRINYETGIAFTLNNQGIAKFKKGDMSAALKLMIEAEKLFLKNGEKGYALSTQIGQATVFLQMNNTAMSLILYQRAEKTAIEINNQQALMDIHMNIGSVYNKQLKLDKAVMYYERALAKAKELNQHYQIMVAESNLGTIYYELKQYSKAVESETHALQMAEELGDENSMVSILTNLASAQMVLGNRSDALKFISRSLDSLAKNPDNESLMHACKIKSDILRLMGKEKEAFVWMDLHLRYKDSLMNNEQQNKLAELQAMYEDDKKEHKIRQLELRETIGKLQLEKSNQQNRVYIVSILASVILLLIATGAFLSNRKKNRELEVKNKLIQENLKEKEILLMEVHHRVKNNLQMIYSILNMQSKNLPEEVAAILNENKERIRSISIVHEKLYRNEDISAVNLKDLITDIALNACKNSPFASSTQIDVRCEDLHPDLDTLLSIGIMVNELVTNVFKYAFTDKQNNILHIGLHKSEGFLRLTVNDNGKGFPAGFKVSEPRSFGFKMLQTLCKKLKGTINVWNENGAKVEVVMERFALLS